ncbi:hypothetical protein TWF730_009671 [Orbilia blumenaviensis]|uniref:Uncharacterized protein n=1 Tax=Orbilia blumenaviensis TaxID=1796055 RepID=A0AAV9UT92_9PEZI
MTNAIDYGSSTEHERMATSITAPEAEDSRTMIINTLQQSSFPSASGLAVTLGRATMSTFTTHISQHMPTPLALVLEPATLQPLAPAKSTERKDRDSAHKTGSSKRYNRKVDEHQNQSRVVPPAIFFSVAVSCPNPGNMLALQPMPGPLAYRSFPQLDVYLPDNRMLTISGERPSLSSDFANVLRSVRVSTWWYNTCKSCRCNIETGRLEPFEGDPALLVTRPGCWCNYEMRQPEMAEGTPVSDYIDALERIPFPAQFQNRHYRWDDKGTGYEPFTGRKNSQTDQSLPSDELNSYDGIGNWNIRSPSKQLAPGTKQPYYLEGPRARLGWESLMNGGIRMNSVSSPQLAKRDWQDQGRDGSSN